MRLLDRARDRDRDQGRLRLRLRPHRRAGTQGRGCRLAGGAASVEEERGRRLNAPASLAPRGQGRGAEWAQPILYALDLHRLSWREPMTSLLPARTSSGSSAYDDGDGGG